MGQEFAYHSVQHLDGCAILWGQEYRALNVQRWLSGGVVARG